jgi:hypothetical protein
MLRRPRCSRGRLEACGPGVPRRLACGHGSSFANLRTPRDARLLTMRAEIYFYATAGGMVRNELTAYQYRNRFLPMVGLCAVCGTIAN